MDKILTNIGLCMASGGIASGEDMVCDYLRQGKIFYIFLASNASDNAKKKINDKAHFYNVEVCMNYSSEELSKAVGKNNRMVLGITNRGFVKILKG